MGEKGGVGASSRLAEASGRGVEPLDGTPPPNPGVLCADAIISPVRGVVSDKFERALRGVRVAICGRCCCCCWLTMVSGVMWSVGAMAFAQGLLEGSSTTATATATARVRLSLLLSRMLLGSPRTAPARVRPDEAGPPELDVEESGAAALELELDVSM